jgi:hypothetical protein
VANPLQITVKPNAYNRKVELLVSELDARTSAIIDWLPFMVAGATLTDIKSGAPTDIAGYPKMLKLRGLSLKGVDSTVAITVPGYSHSQRLKAEDAPVTLLFIKAVRRRNPDTGKRESSPVARLLAKHSPWTMRTLPVELPRSLATLRAVRASEREVMKISQMRREDLDGGVKETLKRYGVTLRKGTDRFSRKATRDLAFEVLRREFGIEARHRAHWRPAIKAAQVSHVDASLKKLVRWLTVPTERRWKKNLVIKKAPPSVAKRVKRFQGAVAKT